MRKCGPQRNQTKYIFFERFWWELCKNVTFIEFEPLCQKLWVFMSSFTMTTHQIWSCHVTLAANFETFYFSPYFVLTFRKSDQIWRNWLKNKKVTGKNKPRGGKHSPSPSAYRVKVVVRACYWAHFVAHAFKHLLPTFVSGRAVWCCSLEFLYNWVWNL